MITIYTDGACKNNPGVGGWGAVIINKEIKEICGGESNTTNNRMELYGAISALTYIKTPEIITLWSDSQYLVRGMNEWIENWVKRNWSKVKNVDLWKDLLQLNSFHKVTWCWVLGHNGDMYNERADALANLGILQVQAK